MQFNTNPKIQNYLKLIQEENEIEILLACETGSRAWGFPSPDSDYDVRFIYRHQMDWYLRINDKKDTIERMYENRDIDLSMKNYFGFLKNAIYYLTIYFHKMELKLRGFCYMTKTIYEKN